MSKYWQIEEIKPAFTHANILPANPDAPFQMPKFSKDNKGRAKLPAFLVTSYKAS